MRTTLNIDDDVLLAVQERARAERRSTGEILSELARHGLRGNVGPGPASDRYVVRNGFVARRARGGIVTNELVQRIRDEEGV